MALGAEDWLDSLFADFRCVSARLSRIIYSQVASSPRCKRESGSA
jgi:hypothetical protein